MAQMKTNPHTRIPAATDISSRNDTRSPDLPSKPLLYDSMSRQTSTAFSSSTAGLSPAPSPAGSSITIACPVESSGDSTESSTVAPGGTSSFSLKHWKWEIAACFLILVVPTIVVATVFPHRNQPIPQWPFKISINALLSIYALVFKSAIAYVVTSCVGQLQWSWFSSDSRPLSDAVLFDGAGRGPWGLLVMLWAHRHRQPLIILAAVIVISGVAIDPFIQQIVRPFDCSVPLGHDLATLPRTNRIDSYFSSGDGEQTSAHTLRSALISGLYLSGNETPYECSTGNCTFSDVYSTVGICGACEDRSANTVVESTGLGGAYGCDTQNITTYLPSGEQGYYWGVNGNQIGTNFTDACNVDQHTDIAQMDVWSPMPSDDFSVRVDIVIGRTKFSDAGLLISTGQNIPGCDTAEANSTWACRGYGAASCTLKPCVRTYSASIEAGYLKEQVVSQSADIKWGQVPGSGLHGLVDTHCISAQEEAFLTARGYELRNTTRWIPFYGDLNRYNSTEYDPSSDWSIDFESLLHHKCVYLISSGFLYKVGYGTEMGPFARNPAASQFVGTTQGLSWDVNESGETVVTIFDGPEVLQSIYNYGRVDFERIQSVFENISDSVTTFIRTHGNTSYSEPARGQVQHYATCLGIQWPWITLPAVLAVLSILFLALVIESTRRHETPLWKASPLPWILGGGLAVRSATSPVGSQGQLKGGVSVARMEDESRQILATVSKGSASRIEMVDMRDQFQVDGVRCNK